MKSESYPRVLVISHNVFSNTTNIGKTLTAFFNNWKSDNLAQLYLYSEYPNTKVCNKYFRVTDFEMLESIFKLKSPGTVLNINDTNTEIAPIIIDSNLKTNIYNYGKRKKPYMYLIRNLIWTTNKWNNEKFSKWLEDFNPEVIFYMAGDYSFSMKIALKICREKGLPLVVFLGDEYFYLDINKNSLIEKINRGIFKKSFIDMFSYLNTFIAASDNMQKKYSDEFNKKGYTIMTPVETIESFKVDKTNKNLKISYIGNLSLDRWRPLVEIGKSLKKLGYSLDIYSEETRIDILSQLNLDNGIKFKGAIPASIVKDVIKSSTIIVHVESSDELNSQKTKYSMSTKIAESLGSGVCLFAYGPDCASSIEYLIINDAACVVTKKEDLEAKIEEILKNENIREKYIKNALKLALEKHSLDINTQIFYKIIKDTCENWKSRLKNENFTG